MFRYYKIYFLQEFPTFCYTTANVNMIGKIGTNTSGATAVPGSVNIAQLTTGDDKTCYIAQPFSYNYALVNQMQIAPNGIQNTISNISFKCDVCGLMFGHLALLNAHKRIHAQDTGKLELFHLILSHISGDTYGTKIILESLNLQYDIFPIHLRFCKTCLWSRRDTALVGNRVRKCH